MYYDTSILNRFSNDPEGLACFFSGEILKDKEKIFPINPFEVLNDLGIPFVFRKMKKLEGVLLMGEGEESNLIAINSKRPIQRQRFTCAHEICHYIKDAGSYQPGLCTIGSRNKIERYAESFAAAFLMPRDELLKEIKKRRAVGRLSMDDIIYIAEHFGVSFSSCLTRIKYCARKSLPENYESFTKRKPAIRRAELELADDRLLLMTLDSWHYSWSENTQCKAAFVYKNRYIYNDARLENVNVNPEQAAEIITDLRLKQQNSVYCTSDFSAFHEIAGHSQLYDFVFENCNKENISIYDIVQLNRILFSCIPAPEFGGRTRNTNAIVLGSKFETVDYQDVMPSLIALAPAIEDLEKNHANLSNSDILSRIVDIHHRLTVIHPFPDGNGRTIRAFTNLLLMRYKLPPVFISLEDKEKYINALSFADERNDLSQLKSVYLVGIFRGHAEFYSML